jgi:HEAT repeat protein
LVIKILGALKNPKAVDDLLYTLRKTGNDITELMIIEALGKIGDRRALAPLFRELKVVDRKDQGKVYDAYGKIIEKSQEIKKGKQ